MKKGLKIILGLLVAANLVFFALMESGLFDANTAANVQPNLHAEKITLLSDAQVAAAIAQPKSAVANTDEMAASAVPAVNPDKSGKVACYEWGDFADAELERASGVLKNLQLGKRLSSREIEHVIGYWVYIPPLKDKAAVAQKIAQLKARGVPEYFAVQEAGEWLNAISLGVFKTQAAAQHFLDSLNAKDVRTAKVGERAGKTQTTLFVINGLDVKENKQLMGFQKDFQGTELKSVSCH